MDNTELVAELCDIIDRMNVILQAQAMELAQLHALHHEEEIAAVRRDYAQAIGEVSTRRRRKSWPAAGSFWRL